LAERGIATDGLFSKHLQDFAGQRFDVVITVCDRARDACPVFPGGTEQIHWSFPDPSAAQGTEAERLNVFRAVRQGLTERLGPFIDARRHKRDRAAIVMT